MVPFDRATLICESIARKIFPSEIYLEYQDMGEALRKALELPEVYMAAKQWSSIPYNRVASVANKLYRGKFMKHDEERFGKYLENVKAGESRIAAGALLPHSPPQY